jgi:N6-adenosine-specific RNA methylase IME4
MRGRIPKPSHGPLYSTLLFDPHHGKPVHSKKPPQSYRDIEALSPAPRLELFARRPRKGWDCWGLEAKDIDLELEADMEELL